MNAARHESVDPRLSALEELLDSSTAARVLAPLLGRRVPQLEVAGISLLAHKPGRRASLALVVRAGSERFELFAKLYAHDRGERIFNAWTELQRRMDGPSVCVPRPLGWDPDRHLLVTEFRPGRPLALAEASLAPARHAARVAAHLHGCRLRGMREWSPVREMDVTRRFLAQLAAAEPSLAGYGRQLAARLAHRLPAAGPERVIHRDFYPEQMLRAGKSTTLIDLDEMRAGDPAVDVGNYLAHVELRALQFPALAAIRSAARRAFFETYQRTARGDTERLCGLEPSARFYEAASLLRLSGVYAGRPRWRERLPALLLARAAECITTIEATGPWPSRGDTAAAHRAGRPEENQS